MRGGLLFNDMFGSFSACMNDELIIGDTDFVYLTRSSIPDGIMILYSIFGTHDREWFEIPWTDIGEEVPKAVSFVLDVTDHKKECIAKGIF